MEGSCYVVVECRENAVVNSGNINAELFLEVDWWVLYALPSSSPL